MKRTLLSIIVVLSLLAGCGRVEEQPPVMGESSAESGPEALADEPEQPQEPVSGPLELPDPESIPLEPLPFDPMERWSGPMELVYEASPAGADFLEALEQAGLPPMDGSINFAAVGEYVLYYTMDTPMGPSRLCVEGPELGVEVLLESSQAIFGMHLQDARTLVLELVNILQPEGHAGMYYEFNLATGELTPSPYGTSGSSYTQSHTLYRGRHYRTNHADGATEMGEGYDLYVQTLEGDYRQILAFANSFQYYGGAIYYMERDRLEILRGDLLGETREVFQSFGGQLYDFQLMEGALLYSSGSGRFLRDLAGGTDTLLEPGSSLFIGDGYYCVAHDNTLAFIPWQGEPRSLYTNFRGYLLAAVGNRLYYQTFHGGDINRYRYWRLEIGEAEPIPLN